MTGLKQQTVKRILTEGQFDMFRFGSVEELANPGCGTASCIAGNIVAAAADLNLPIPDGTGFISKSHRDGRRQHGILANENRTAAIARELWATQYGPDEAERLQFEEDGWGWRMDRVTPEEAAAHVLGGDPNPHGDLPNVYELRQFRP